MKQKGSCNKKTIQSTLWTKSFRVSQPWTCSQIPKKNLLVPFAFLLTILALPLELGSGEGARVACDSLGTFGLLPRSSICRQHESVPGKNRHQVVKKGARVKFAADPWVQTNPSCWFAVYARFSNTCGLTFEGSFAGPNMRLTWKAKHRWRETVGERPPRTARSNVAVQTELNWLSDRLVPASALLCFIRVCSCC